jgi:hypothetical protein
MLAEIVIEMDNDAFVQRPTKELMTVLVGVIEQVSTGGMIPQHKECLECRVPLFDTNGNNIGYFSVKR